MKRGLIIVAAALAAAGVGYLLLRDRGPDSPATARRDDGPPTAAASPDAATSPRPPGLDIPAPRRLASDGGVAAPTAVPPTPPAPPLGSPIRFEAELRDPDWAVEQEREMTLRLRGVVSDLSARGAIVDVDGIDCRRTMCQIRFHARDVAALGTLYGALEDETGLYGWADSVLLDAVETAPDGQVTTRVTAVFERD